MESIEKQPSVQVGIKYVAKQIYTFIQEEWNTGFFIFMAVFLTTATYFEYTLDFEDTFIEKYSGNLNQWLAYCVEYSFMYIIPFLAHSFFYKRWHYWANPKFIATLLFSIMLFSLRHSYTIDYTYYSNINQDLKRFARRTLGQAFMMVSTIVPMFIFWFFMDRKQQPFYGFSKKHINLRPYWIMLALMLPLLMWASTQTDFLNMYPRMRNMFYADDTIAHQGMYKFIFELVYGLDFISIELFFRGILIVGIAKYAGKSAVFPAACFYLSIHYGKPLGETISSFFGGTILGIVAYYGKSIYGGIMVHMGIAWLMELGGYIGNVIKGNEI